MSQITPTLSNLIVGGEEIATLEMLNLPQNRMMLRQAFSKVKTLEDSDVLKDLRLTSMRLQEGGIPDLSYEAKVEDKLYHNVDHLRQELVESGIILRKKDAFKEGVEITPYGNPWIKITHPIDVFIQVYQMDSNEGSYKHLSQERLDKFPAYFMLRS